MSLQPKIYKPYVLIVTIYFLELGIIFCIVLNQYYCNMSEQHNYAIDQVKLCQCHLCKYSKSIAKTYLQSDIGTSNCMADFIKLLPIGFPLIIEQTIILHQRQEGSMEYHSYLNPPLDQRKKYNIIHQNLRSINPMIAQNVQLYFKDTQRILPKFQAVSFLEANKGQQVLYVQPYQHSPIIRIEFPSQTDTKYDNILREYLAKEAQRCRGEGYKYNQQFLQWVFRQYGQQVFFYFLTDLCARIFKVMTRGQIKHAIFFWIAERSTKDILTVQKKGGERQNYNAMQQLGRPKRLKFKPKLVNIRNFKMQKIEKLYSFQEEYQSLIKQRIANSTKKTISAIKNKAYRGRLINFRNKIQQVFQREQKKIMDGVEEEKQFEYQVDSQKMARLLIPNLGPNQNLRQVLNDEKAFRQVFLSNKKDKNLKTLPSLSRQNISSHTKSVVKTPQKIDLLTESRIQKRYERLLTTPSILD